MIRLFYSDVEISLCPPIPWQYGYTHYDQHQHDDDDRQVVPEADSIFRLAPAHGQVRDNHSDDHGECVLELVAGEGAHPDD
jgi:hypothetical protein